MSLAVEAVLSLDFLVFLVEAQFRINVLLVEADEHGSAEEGIEEKDCAWECSDHSHTSLDERENSHDGKRKAHEVGLSHIDGDASVQEVLHESDNIEAQKNVANVVSVVCTNKIQVNLWKDHANRDNLKSELSLLVEGILAPALHCKPLVNGERNLVVILGESKSKIWISDQRDDHADQEEVIAFHKVHGTANSQHEWSEVYLNCVEVPNVCEVEVAEHADHRVCEDDHGQTLMITLLVLENLGEEAGKWEEEHGKNDA